MASGYVVAVVLARGPSIGIDQLPERIRGATPEPSARASSSGFELSPLLKMPFREAKDTAVKSFERLYVEGLLAETGGNISDAARRAGLDRSNFRRVLTKHDVDASAFRDDED